MKWWRQFCEDIQAWFESFTHAPGSYYSADEISQSDRDVLMAAATAAIVCATIAACCV